jgi:hypothetical protein
LENIIPWEPLYSPTKQKAENVLANEDEGEYNHPEVYAPPPILKPKTPKRDSKTALKPQ